MHGVVSRNLENDERSTKLFFFLIFRLVELSRDPDRLVSKHQTFKMRVIINWYSPCP